MEFSTPISSVTERHDFNFPAPTRTYQELVLGAHISPLKQLARDRVTP